jgi:hypothetical protein
MRAPQVEPGGNPDWTGYRLQATDTEEQIRDAPVFAPQTHVCGHSFAMIEHS